MRRFLGPVAALVLVAVAVYFWVFDERSSETPGQPPPTSTATATPTSAPISEAALSRINRRVKLFSEQYYARSPERSAEDIKQMVTPYVTPYFLQNATFGYGSSKAELQMQEEEASQRISDVSEIIGMFTDEQTLVGTVTMRKTKLDQNGQIVTSFEDSEELVLVKSEGVWLIYEATP